METSNMYFKIPYCIQNGWQSLKEFVSPRQQWLTSKIPNRWIDKDELWEICIFEGIKHAVEHDHLFNNWDDEDWREAFERCQSDSEYPEQQKAFERELKLNYELITIRIPMLETNLENARLTLPEFDFSNGFPKFTDGCRKTFDVMNKIEEEISGIKTHIMLWAVKNRESIWS